MHTHKTNQAGYVVFVFFGIVFAVIASLSAYFVWHTQSRKQASSNNLVESFQQIAGAQNGKTDDQKLTITEWRVAVPISDWSYTLSQDSENTLSVYSADAKNLSEQMKNCQDYTAATVTKTSDETQETETIKVAKKGNYFYVLQLREGQACAGGMAKITGSAADLNDQLVKDKTAIAEAWSNLTTQ